ncbi:hypothetical protein ACWE42_10035 [Sutcliffiella cohnii]|uniref:Uncharacterized protein n=1 Tax=Sutcliffiella cohnii TaxID=33932 RepID=A0A223KP39_9BACI|nr:MULTISPECIES: hypothetical protein [Sutcliffiella]AST91270.1 hypothetical protein BC6307_08265 [Sutcliffiella cohnii]WBL17096.1 hypothetical protein O1A01_10880 [Sutcliffiella sp. NC1]
MFTIGFIDNTDLANMFIVVFAVISFYYTLTFFEDLRKEDERVIKQTKRWAIINFALAIIILTFK